MSPVTHFFAGWVLACASPVALTRREKALVVAAAVAPDLDGLGIIPELLTRHSSHPLLWFSEYHHELHTLAFAIICTIVAFLLAGPLAKRRKPWETRLDEFATNTAEGASGPSASLSTAKLELPQPRAGLRHPGMTAFLVLVSFHLHLLCDLVGARGPDGYPWPIPYLKPFSNAAQLAWHGQWALNGWQNFVITGLLLAATLWLAWRFETSPLELVSGSTNRAFTRTLRQRFPLKANRAISK